MSDNNDDILDAAVVGGGVSGLYSAWRLMRDAGPATFPGPGRPRITVFEGGKSTGGRLLSLTPPGMPNTRCELGGMRFMSRHVLVNGLVQLFNLPTVAMPVDEPGNIAYLRGQQLRLSDLVNADALPYHLRSVEKSVLAGNLLMFALKQIVPNCINVDYATLLVEMQTATFGGKPLHQQGFWNVMARILSPDALALVRDTGGYDCLVSNWSAADAIPFILADFGAGVTYSRIVTGYDQVPQRLQSEFEAAGGSVKCGAGLRSFDVHKQADGSPLVLLNFSDGSSVRARHLVLAMPRRSIELIDPTGPVLDPGLTEVRALIESVEPIPLFKIFLCYPYPWWKAVGVSTGRSITDMPIRQTYYWAVEPKDAHTDGNSALLASYDDDLSVTFWAGLRNTKGGALLWEPQQIFAGEQAPSEDWADYRAPREMVLEAHRQLMQMHGVSYAPEPYDAAYRDWAEAPFGGGVNLWNIHAKSWEVIPAVVNPVPGLPVYICGEAYSHEQGWVEGALQTAEIMLTTYFKLQPRA